MRYQLDSTMRFRHIGNILNCADGSILNPLDFTITSDIVNIKTNKRHVLTVRKDTQLVEFTLSPDTLPIGHYEWHCYLRNDVVSWRAPAVIVEVN